MRRSSLNSFPKNPKYRSLPIPAIAIPTPSEVKLSYLRKERREIREKEKREKEKREAELLESHSILPAYRNDIRKTDKNIKKIIAKMTYEDKKNLDDFKYDVSINIIPIKSDFKRIYILNTIMKYDLDISEERYLSIEEIALLLLFFMEILDIFITRTNILDKYTVDNSIKIYDIFYRNIYNILDIDADIYNLWINFYLNERLKESINDTRLSEEKKKTEIDDFYYTCLLDMLTYTPLRKMGDYDNTIDFYKNFLAFLILLQPKR